MSKIYNDKVHKINLCFESAGMSSKDITQIHPFFKLPSVRVFWHDTVQKINRHGSQQARLLIIASPGLFMFEKRSLGGYKWSRVISYSELKYIEANEKSTLFQSQNNKMEFIHPQSVEIVSIVLSIQNSLFPPITPKLSKCFEDQISNSEFVFESETPICDRFMSMALPNYAPEKYDELSGIAKYLSEASTEIAFPPETIESVFKSAVVEAVMVDDTITTLVISTVSFYNFVDDLSRILRTSTSIDTIRFNGIVFEGKSGGLVGFFSTVVISPISTIIFDHCEISSNKFTNVLLAFSKFRCRITYIKVINCLFSDETLKALFTALFHSPCFKFLQKFEAIACTFTDVIQDLVLQLTDRSKTRLWSSFTNVVFDSITLNGGQMLPAFAELDSNLSSLALRNCDFKTPLEIPITSFGKLSVIDLSGAWFSSESLLTLFSSLAFSQPSPTTLILNHLHMTEDSLSKFFTKVTQFELPAIRRLSWENNTLRGNNVGLFFAFLRKIPNLVDLAISNTLFSTTESAIQTLVQYLKSVRLERFVMRGFGKTAFGSSFKPVLLTLSESFISSLDITGQLIDDESLDILTKMMNTSLTGVAFDGQCPKNPATLLSAIEGVLHPNITFAVWPEESIHTVLSTLPLAKRADACRSFDTMKKRFISKFERLITHCIGCATTIIEESVVPLVSTNTETASALSTKIDMALLMKVEDSLQDLVDECLGVDYGSALTSILTDFCVNIGLSEIV